MEEFNSSTERLAHIIENSGLSQRRFAMECGIDPSNITKILNGTINLSVSVAKKIEERFGYNSMWLIKGVGKAKDDISKRIKGSIPFFSEIPVSAGSAELANTELSNSAAQYISIPGLATASYAFPVIGCSMEPTIKAGDIIAVSEINSWERVDPDKIYMILTHDDRMIKHLATDDEDKDSLWCLSDNESYPKFRIYKTDIIRLWKVVFHGRIL